MNDILVTGHTTPTGLSAREERELQWYFSDHTQEIMACQRTATFGPMLDRLQEASRASITCPLCDGAMATRDKRGKAYTCVLCEGDGTIEVTHGQVHGRRARTRNGILVAEGSDWFNGDLTAQPNQKLQDAQSHQDGGMTPSFTRLLHYQALRQRMHTLRKYDAKAQDILERMFGVIGQGDVDQSTREEKRPNDEFAVIQLNRPGYRGEFARLIPIMLMNRSGCRLGQIVDPKRIDVGLRRALKLDYELGGGDEFVLEEARLTASRAAHRAGLKWRATDAR